MSEKLDITRPMTPEETIALQVITTTIWALRRIDLRSMLDRSEACAAHYRLPGGDPHRLAVSENTADMFRCLLAVVSCDTRGDQLMKLGSCEGGEPS